MQLRNWKKLLPLLAIVVLVLAMAVTAATAAPTAGDRDGDGLPDALEEATCTNPDLPDTDGDGIWDGPGQGQVQARMRTLPAPLLATPI